MAKINSKQKGNTNERECAKILNERFGADLFKRVPFSGAFVGGQNRYNANVLTEEQKLAFASDIICPVWFRYAIEHKAYASMSFWDLFNESSDLNSWLKQAQGDADFVKKDPMVVVKINNHKRIVFIHQKIDGYVFEYRGWYCMWFADLLLQQDGFFKVD